MKVILVSDIFGRNDSFLEIKDFIKNLGCEVFIHEPYNKEKKIFSKQENAYETFIKECGHKKYYESLETFYNKIQAEYIVSFSAGASASWLLSSKYLPNCKKILCFYPTSIRNNYDMNALTQIKVFFAKKENSYNVKDIFNKIKNKKNISLEIVSSSHGFMNKETNQNSSDFLYGLKLIKNELS